MGASSKSTKDSCKTEIEHLRKDIKRLQEHKKSVKAHGQANRAGGVNTHSIDQSIKSKRERIAYLQNLMKKK